jgi:hypothetical protein
MRKGFTRKPQRDEPATPGKNYITRSGLQRLKDEHRFLLTRTENRGQTGRSLISICQEAGKLSGLSQMLHEVLQCLQQLHPEDR